MSTATPEREYIRIIRRRGHFWVFGVFLAVLAALVGMCFGMPVDTNRAMLIAIPCAILWMAALFVGVWYRQAWARGFLIILLVASVLVTVIYMAGRMQLGEVSVFTAMVTLAGVVVQTIAIGVLSTSRAIKNFLRS